MGDEDLVLSALAALPRWHVVHWATLRDVQREQDAAALARPEARTAQERLIDLWQEPMPEGVTRAWQFPRGGFIRWGCNGRLHVEAGEGGAYTQPMPEPLRDVLVDLGWQAPDLSFRNCWLQPDAADLARAAAISVLTPMAAFGYEAPPPFDF
jgi:hypothetical protein